MVDNNLDNKRLASTAIFNYWSVVSNLLKLFAFDTSIIQEISQSIYPVLTEKTLDFLDETVINTNAGARLKGSNWTKMDGQFNQIIFGLIKQTYVPVVLHELKMEEKRDQAITKYQEICLKAWRIISALRGIFELEALQEFLELAFNEQIMEMYASLGDKI